MAVFQIIVILVGTTALILVFENKFVGLSIGLGYGVLMYLGGKQQNKNR